MGGSEEGKEQVVAIAEEGLSGATGIEAMPMERLVGPPWSTPTQAEVAAVAVAVAVAAPLPPPHQIWAPPPPPPPDLEAVEVEVLAFAVVGEAALMVGLEEVVVRVAVVEVGVTDSVAEVTGATEDR